MPVYLIAEVEVTDPTRYRDYMRHTPRLVAEHGGRFVARGAAPVVLEGPPTSKRIVVIEFPSMEHAKSFYDSPDYVRARAIRAEASTAQVVVIESYPEADWQSALAASQLESF
jgi:uncharacterized protein (DUF1330 family)